MTQSLLQDIEKWNEEFVLALRRDDVEQAAALFSEQALIVPPGSRRPPAPQDLKMHLKQLSQWALEMKVHEVSAIGEAVAREVGALRLTRRVGAPPKPGANPVQGPILCRYLGVFEKVGGVWRRNSLIWNRAAQGGPGAGQGVRRPGQQGGGGRPPYAPRLG